jgi:hypothetical protein
MDVDAFTDQQLFTNPGRSASFTYTSTIHIPAGSDRVANSVTNTDQPAINANLRTIVDTYPIPTFCNTSQCLPARARHNRS